MTESVNMKATGSGTLPELHCAICAQASHGCHFGVVACRPCAAFFRRCVIENRTYNCLRGTNKCDIREEGHRNACKACRLRLCRQAGMNYNFSSIEDNDKDLSFSFQSDLQDQMDSSNTPVGKAFDDSYAPNLAKIIRAYNSFIDGQRSLHEVTVDGNIDDFTQIQSDSKPLYFTMLNDGFQIFSQMENKTKLTILDFSYRQFTMLHSCYLTVSQFPDIDDTRFVVNFGYVINIDELDGFIEQLAKDKPNPEEYIRLKKPLMEKYYKFISNLKKFPEGIKQQDICAMMAVTIWNITQQEFGQTKINKDIPEWVRCKETFLSEWLADLTMRFDNKTHEPAILMAQLLCKLVELNHHHWKGPQYFLTFNHHICELIDDKIVIQIFGFNCMHFSFQNMY
uniref:Nuclear receptor domain-containing protein n=1 Tax=Meloidogyne incognita TaxID=6306 RepID=A0A914MQF9_MELIC